MAGRLSQITTSIEAQASFGFGHVQIVRRVWDEPIDVVAAPDEHRLEFAMLPRSSAARGWFPDRQRIPQSVRIGEVFFFPAGQVVHAQSHCRRQYSVVCSFRPEAVDLWFHSAITSLNVGCSRPSNFLHRASVSNGSPTRWASALRLPCRPRFVGQQVRDPATICYMLDMTFDTTTRWRAVGHANSPAQSRNGAVVISRAGR